jgi:phenylalanyl-tRNA synthetase alpha chain
MLEQKISEIEKRAKAAFMECESSSGLYDLKVKYLGKQGEFSLLMREMGKLPKEERPAFGKKVNEVKVGLETVYGERELSLKKKELSARLESERLDMTLPGPKVPEGSRHLVSQVIHEIVDILSRLGYAVRTGPLIESDWFNFEALNLPPNHPARDMQDTFYVDETHVLRTHTSPVQIHSMLEEKLPLRVLAPGGTFRCDADTSHSPHFHQIECMLIDKKVSMSDLKGTISYFVRALFGEDIKTRFRPSFFPFTEPSAEVDCSCPICKGKGCRMCSQTGWIEIGGSGLINPKVLEAAKIDPSQWQGFAFGFGIERMAVIKHGVEHIRLFTENDKRFLEQFKQ